MRGKCHDAFYKDLFISYLRTYFGLVANVDSETSSAKLFLLIDFNTKQMGSNVMSYWEECE